MIALTILLAMPGAVPPQADADALMRGAAARLTVAGTAGPIPPADASWRLDDEADAAPTSKDRAIRADGTACGTIGPTPCRRPPRRLLSAPMGR